MIVTLVTTGNARLVTSSQWRCKSKSALLSRENKCTRQHFMQPWIKCFQLCLALLFRWTSLRTMRNFPQKYLILQFIIQEYIITQNVEILYMAALIVVRNNQTSILNILNAATTIRKTWKSISVLWDRSTSKWRQMTDGDSETIFQNSPSVPFYSLFHFKCFLFCSINVMKVHVVQ